MEHHTRKPRDGKSVSSSFPLFLVHHSDDQQTRQRHCAGQLCRQRRWRQPDHRLQQRCVTRNRLESLISTPVGFLSTTLPRHIHTTKLTQSNSPFYGHALFWDEHRLPSSFSVPPCHVSAPLTVPPLRQLYFPLTELIQALTAEANELCRQQNRDTIKPEDIVTAVEVRRASSPDIRPLKRHSTNV